MQLEHPPSQSPIHDEVYLKIWEIEQEHARMRWTVITFFMSVSFAIFGFSFQENLSHAETLPLRVAGLLVYWFAFVLLTHFYRFTTFLRKYLAEMEGAKQTTLGLQNKANQALIAIKPFSTIGLILCFGVLYTVGVLLLFFLDL